MASAERGDFVPAEWVQESAEGSREYARYLANDLQVGVRKIWPDCHVEDVPLHVTDDEIYTWMAGGYTVQYVPHRRLTPELIRCLDVRLDDPSIDFLATCGTDTHDAFQLSGGWKLVENKPRTVLERDEKLGLEEIMAEQLQLLDDYCAVRRDFSVRHAPRVYELLYNHHEVPAIRRQVTTSVGFPRAVDLLLLRNLAASEESAVERELCTDAVPGEGTPKVLSMQHHGDESRVVPFKTIDQYSGGIRRVWDIPRILRAA